MGRTLTFLESVGEMSVKLGAADECRSDGSKTANGPKFDNSHVDISVDVISEIYSGQLNHLSSIGRIQAVYINHI